MPSLLVHLLTGFDARILRVAAPGEHSARAVLSALLAAVDEATEPGAHAPGTSGAGAHPPAEEHFVPAHPNPEATPFARPSTTIDVSDCRPRGCPGDPPTLDDTWQTWCARATAALIDPEPGSRGDRLAGTGGNSGTLVEYSAGPDSGFAHALPPGTWSLGRTCDADRPLADPFLSRTPLLMGNGPGGITLGTCGGVERTFAVDPAGPQSFRLGSTRVSIHPPGPPSPPGPVTLHGPEPPEVRLPETPSWTFYILPLVLGIVLVLVTGMWWFLLFTLSGPLTAGVRWRMETRRWKRESAESVVEFRRALTEHAAEVTARIDIATSTAAATPLESGLVVLGYGRALSPDTLAGLPGVDRAGRRTDRRSTPPGIARLLDRFSVPVAVIDGSTGAVTEAVGSQVDRRSRDRHADTTFDRDTAGKGAENTVPGRNRAGRRRADHGATGRDAAGDDSAAVGSVGSPPVGRGSVHPVLEDCALLFDPSAADLDVSGVPEVVGDVVRAVVASARALGLPVAFADSSVAEVFPELTGYGVDVAAADGSADRVASSGITIELAPRIPAAVPSGSSTDPLAPDDRARRPHVTGTRAGSPTAMLDEARTTSLDSTESPVLPAVPAPVPAPAQVPHRREDDGEQIAVSIRCPASTASLGESGRSTSRATPPGGVVPRWRIDCTTPLSTAELSLVDAPRPRRHPVPLGGAIELRRLRPERFLQLVPPPAAPVGAVPASRTLDELLAELSADHGHEQSDPEAGASGAGGRPAIADTFLIRGPRGSTDSRAGLRSSPSDWRSAWGSVHDSTARRDTARSGTVPRGSVPGGSVPSGPSSTGSAPTGATRVPLGSTSTGALLVDLVEDGPHALVAGTTGSGKSVLLQTWVAALSAVLSPDELRFVLIDFKGGAAFAPFAELAHVDAVVDNLEPTQAMRALRSLRAEILRREALLAEQRCPDIDALNAAIQHSDDRTALPRIVVVIDEFQALIQDNPAGVEMIESLTALGRSLGIHLILATQRPSGIVTSRMKANISLRLALRVRDSADSIEVIGTDAAAHLRPDDPGAALLSRTGPPELFRGAQVTVSPAQHPPAPPRVDWTALLGRRATTRSPAPRDTMSGSAALPAPGPTTGAALTVPALVSVSQHFIAGSTGRTRRRIVLPPMPVSHAALSSTDLGLLDFPDENRTARWIWDPVRDGSVIITGGRGRGTSTAVRSFAAAAVSTGSRVVLLTRGRRDRTVEEILDTRNHEDGAEPGELIVADHAEVWAVEYLLGLLETDDDPRPRMICIDDFDALLRTLEGTRRLSRLEALLTSGAGRSPTAFVIAAGRRILHSPIAARARTRVIFPPADPQETAHLGLQTRRFSGAWPPGRAVVLGPVSSSTGPQGADVQLSHTCSDRDPPVPGTSIGAEGHHRDDTECRGAGCDADRAVPIRSGSRGVRGSVIEAGDFGRNRDVDHWVHRSARRRSSGADPHRPEGSTTGAAAIIDAEPGRCTSSGVGIGVGPCGETVTWIPDIDGPVLSVRTTAALTPSLVTVVEQTWHADVARQALLTVPEAHLADPSDLATALTAPACVIGWPLQHTPGYSSPLSRVPGLGPMLVIGARTAGELAEVGLRDLPAGPGGQTRGWYVTAERAIPVDVSHLFDRT